MTGAPRVRPISAHDWDRVAGLEAAAYSGRGMSEGRTVLRTRGAASPATCFVVETVDRRLAGYVLAFPYPLCRSPDLAVPERVGFRTRNLHLHDLVVGDEFRGQGLARRLVERVTDVAWLLNYERMSLVAVGGSRTFWAAFGYRGCPEVAPPSSYGIDALYMTRRLHGTVETGKQTPG